MSATEQLYDVKLNLEHAQQQISILSLEKAEYEKEIIQLKIQNEELSNQVDLYNENEKYNQEYISLLLSPIMNSNEIDSHNVMLNKEICKYQTLLKDLALKNTKLKTENERHRNILEELHQQKQKTDKIHNNNILHLENIIKQLQNQCDQLQEELNAFDMLKLHSKKQIVSCTCIHQKEIEFPHPLIRNGTVRLGVHKMRTLERTFSVDSVSTQNMETEIISNTSNSKDDIINQLTELGYDKSEINMAMDMVGCNAEINLIIQLIENNKMQKYMFFKNGLSEKIEAKIDLIVNTAKKHITRLSKKVKSLQKENYELKLKIHKTNCN